MSNEKIWIGVTTGVIIGVILICSLVFFLLFYFKIIPCDDDIEGNEANREYSGLPLRHQLPLLTEEQRRRRERAMGRYRRNLEREESRRARAQRQQNQGQEGELDEAEIASSSTSTQCTLITKPPESEKSLENSTVVYGRGEYVGHYSVTLLGSCSFHSMGSIHVRRSLSNCESHEVLRLDNRRYRKFLRRQHRFNEQHEADSLNPWDVDGLEDRSTDSDSVSSVASSLPRPPEEVLGENAHMAAALSHITADQPSLHVDLKQFRHDVKHVNHANRNEHAEHSSNALDRTAPRQSQISEECSVVPHADHPLNGENKLNPCNIGDETATTAVTVTSPTTQPLPLTHVSTVSAHPTHSKPSKKKWTRKDAQHNICLSGFFTAPSLAATSGEPAMLMITQETTSPGKDPLSNSLNDASDALHQNPCTNDIEGSPSAEHLPFASSLSSTEEDTAILCNADPTKGSAPDTRSVAAHSAAV